MSVIKPVPGVGENPQGARCDERCEQLLNFFRAAQVEDAVDIGGGTGPPSDHLYDCLPQRGWFGVRGRQRGRIPLVAETGNGRGQIDRHGQGRLEPAGNFRQSGLGHGPGARVCRRADHGVQLNSVKPQGGEDRQQGIDVGIRTTKCGILEGI